MRYPANWTAESPTRYSGADGYFEVSTQTYPASLFDSMGTLCVLEANRTPPAAGGASPFIVNWQAWQPEMQTWAGFGCVVLPGSTGPRDEAVLFARYPQPYPADLLLVLHTDTAHFSGILSSLRFVDYATRAPSTGYYDAPACGDAPAGPPVTTSTLAGLTVTEYAVANAACDPLQQFDGFQARVRGLGLDRSALYADGFARQIEEANRGLQAFGYRLVDRAAPNSPQSCDLYRGEELLIANITRLGPLSVNAAGDDFILWVQGSLAGSPPIEVQRGAERELTVWEPGFDSAWVGTDLVSYEYATAPLSPMGAPSQVALERNGREFLRLAVPPAGSAGYPVTGFWSWDGHWVLEVQNVVVQDGELQNLKLGYAEMFNWHLVGGQPFYFFRQDGLYGMAYAGQALSPRYADLLHGQLCCDPAVYNVGSSPEGAWFYALRDGVWYLVIVEATS